MPPPAALLGKEQLPNLIYPIGSMHWTRSPSRLPPQQIGREELQEVCLNDEAKQTPPEDVRTAEDRPKVFENIAREFMFVGIIAVSAASPVFLQRLLVVIAPDISRALVLTPTEMTWSNAASGLATGAFLIPFGYLADVCLFVSRKTLLLLSLTSFSLLVALASLSASGVALDIMSGLAGLACAANVSIAVAILSLVYPVSSRRRNIVFSTFLMGSPAATIISGLGSGALGAWNSWKYPFIMLAALYAVITILAWAFIPDVDGGLEDTRHKITEQLAPITARTSTPRRFACLNISWGFDWVGTGLLLAGVILFTVALTIGPENTQRWKTPAVIFLMLLGSLFLGCCLIWEYIAESPMIPPCVWEDRRVVMISLSMLSCAMAYYSAQFWLCAYLQRILGLSAFDVAIRILPQAIVGLLISPLVGLLMHKVSGRLLLVVASICSMASNILLTYLHVGSNDLLWVLPSLALSQLGMDWTTNVGSLYVLSALSPNHQAIGVSLLQTTTRLGVPLGLGVTTVVWSAYDGKGIVGHTELPYTKAFVTTMAFAAFSLALAPFIHIGRQGHEKVVEPAPEAIGEIRRPSKRWSLDDEVPAKTGVSGDSRRSLTGSLSPSGNRSADRETWWKTHLDPQAHPRSEGSKIKWVVCERCMSRGPATNSPSTLGDPARYFNDVGCMVPIKQDHDMIVNGSRRRGMLLNHYMKDRLGGI